MINLDDIVSMQREQEGTHDINLNNPAGSSTGLGKSSVNIDGLKVTGMVG